MKETFFRVRKNAEVYGLTIRENDTLKISISDEPKTFEVSLSTRELEEFIKTGILESLEPLEEEEKK